ncbi:RNA methyltransferase [Georgenia subflava]|uniref:RNA methyltransferase n=2 Tax=Georgenia subflava TaxID=1622177 RepID=A0A6N7ERB3_9MICO|nr:RNA methyltransferase [Georgenia subflava]
MTNPRAERVARVRGLSGRSARSRHRQFLVEGPQGVREAVRHVPAQVRDVYLTPDAAVRHPEIVDAARAGGRYLHTASSEVLRAMSTDAQGVLAVLDAAGPTTSAGLADLATTNDGAGPRLVAVLAQVSDPGNAGAVIRAADAAGADAVVLAAGSVEVLNPKVVRSTAGSLFHLPVVTGAGLEETLAALRRPGTGAPVVLAADGAGEWDLDDLLDRSDGLASVGAAELSATALVAPDLGAPTVWVFGNEAHGLSAAERGLCDAAVRVPVHGRAESLNLATAATVCLYASARAQRRTRP